MRIAKELIGKEVMDSDATFIGKVVDVDIEFENDKILDFSLIVSKKGIQETLNIKKGELVIPWDFVKAIGDKLILDYAFEKGVKDIKISDEFVESPVKSYEDGIVESPVKYNETDDLDLDEFEKELNDLKGRI